MHCSTAQQVLCGVSGVKVLRSRKHVKTEASTLVKSLSLLWLCTILRDHRLTYFTVLLVLLIKDLEEIFSFNINSSLIRCCYLQERRFMF